MSFSGGVYTLPGPALNTGEVVSAPENNTFRNDVATAFNLTFLRNGTSTATANLPMGGYKLTGLGVATTSGDALSYGQAAVVSTLGVTSDVTLSGGTANGVAYLNGSKVLTTGSAFVFDGANLGLGVTPSAWGGSYKAIQNAAGFYGNYSTSNIIVGQNWYDSAAGSYKYVNNGYATYYTQASGGHAWYTAPSGTAGNAISFTQAMTLDANGNLGIGTSSPLQALDLVGNARITGNVFIRSANYLRLLEASNNNAYDILNNANNLTFVYNSTERMRIDSSGNLLVGTTSSSSRLAVTGTSASANMITFSDTRTDGASGAGMIQFVRNGSNVGAITTTTTSTAYGTSSDYRLKENIQPMQNALGVVAQLNPVTYNWKADGSNGQGFIAHELQAVVPDCVTGEKDAVDEDGKPVYQGIDTSFLVGILTKAIQELKAELDATKAEVAALKGN